MQIFPIALHHPSMQVRTRGPFHPWQVQLSNLSFPHCFTYVSCNCKEAALNPSLSAATSLADCLSSFCCQASFFALPAASLPPAPLSSHTKNKHKRKPATRPGRLRRSLDLLALDHSGTAEATSAAGGNETTLLSRGGEPVAGGGMANVLVVTTTVGVLHGVHGHTTDLQNTVKDHADMRMVTAN